ncbi:glycosyltransferase family 4 protein [Thermophilibacter sp.]
MISSLYPPNVVGGAEISVEKLATQLAGMGHKVYVLTTGETDRESLRDTGVAVVERRFNNIMSFWEFKHSAFSKRVIFKLIDYFNVLNKAILMRVIQDIQPDVIHANNIYGISPVVWQVAYYSKVPLVQTLRDYYFVCPKANLMRHGLATCSNPLFVCKLFRLFYRRQSRSVTALTAPSSYTLKQFVDERYFENAIQETIYNAIDIEPKRFEALSALRTVSRPDNGAFNVVFVGSLIESKGVRVLLKAIDKVDSSFVFHFAGKGRLLPEVEEFARCHDNIVIHGFLSEDKLNRLLSEMDVLVCPSIWPEPFGRVVLDAYKSCLPVICTNSGGLPELVIDNVTGLIVEPNNAGQLAQAIIEIKGWEWSEDRVRAMEKNLERFSIAFQANQFVELYKQII